MRLFNKVNCCLCGKSVSMMKRTKIQDYICDECKKETHPYIHFNLCNKEEIKKIISQMKKNEKDYKLTEVEWTKKQFKCGNQIYTLYISNSEDIFTLESIETKTYKYHPIFHVNQVKQYSPNVNKNAGSQDNNQGIKYATLEEKVDNKGLPRIYYVRFLYDDSKIKKVKIRFEGAYLKEAKAFCDELNQFIQERKG